MALNVKLMDQIEAASGDLEKTRLIRGFTEEDIKILRLALDRQNVTFGITVGEEPQFDWAASSADPADDFWRAFVDLCNDLKERRLTGGRAELAVLNLLASSTTHSDEKWARRILNRKLRAGFSLTTLNKVFPGSIGKFSVGLAKTFDPEKHDLKGEWIYEPKLDGYRVLVEFRPLSRNGKEYTQFGETILKELEPFLDEWVFDGEWMGDSDFDTSGGSMRRKTEKAGRAKVERFYWVFDMFTHEEWESEKTPPLFERKERLKAFFEEHGSKMPHVKLVPWQPLPRNPDTEQILEASVKKGYEGVMLKNMDGVLEKAGDSNHRSADVLKLKNFDTGDFPIAGYFLGEGKRAAYIGGIVVENAPGILTKVGTGLTDDDLEMFSEDITGEPLEGYPGFFKFKTFGGKIAEIKYQNVIKKTGRLRIPVYIKLRPDKD